MYTRDQPCRLAKTLSGREIPVVAPEAYGILAATMQTGLYFG